MNVNQTKIKDNMKQPSMRDLKTKPSFVLYANIEKATNLPKMDLFGKIDA
jgi:hypothetical protein